MRKDKLKKNGKDFLKDIIALVFIAALCFGGYKLFAKYKMDNAYADSSYKVKTERNSKYNGVYSLTKLDSKGKNTWDGLMLYVKNDKIVSCARIEYTSMEEFKKQFKNNGKGMSLMEMLEKGTIPNGVAPILKTGFVNGSGGSFSEDYSTGMVTTMGEFVCKDKVDFEKVTDIKTDYDFMKDCLIIPGYDEDSREVWLSKLLSNENSEYHKDYKLIHYTGFDDIQKRCKIDNGGCIKELNKLFNAGL